MRDSESRRYIKEECAKIRERIVLEEELRKKREEEERIRKEKIEEILKKIKYRIFKSKVILPTLIVGTGSLITSCVKNEYKLAGSAINKLSIEVGIHGGLKDINENEYIYNLNDHIENGDCVIPNNGTDVEDRISEYCNENDLPECVKVASIEKFHYYMNNDYINGDKINLSSIYNKYNKNPEENIKLSNGDEIIIDDGVVTYVYSDEKSNGISR